MKALAIREDKIYGYETPEFPQSTVNIYVDVEGIPDKDSYYLIGVLIEANDIAQEFSFWADNEHEELHIFQQFINLLSKYGNYTLYHYGSYEADYIAGITRKINKRGKKEVKNS